MKRKGPQRHATEKIQQAIAKYEGGAKLSDIAREFGVRKSTAKYWLDNATKFMGEDSGKNPVTARIQNRLTRETWDIIFAALKTLKGKLEQAPVRDLVAVIKELFDRQAQFGALNQRTSVPPEKVLEKSEEVRITVQKFLQKRDGDAPTPVETSLSGEPPEPLQTETTALPDAPAGPDQGEANGAS